MDKNLADGARKLFADNLYDLCVRNYHKVNKEYIQKQIRIASEYLTDEQKAELRKKGYLA